MILNVTFLDRIFIEPWWIVSTTFQSAINLHTSTVCVMIPLSIIQYKWANVANTAKHQASATTQDIAGLLKWLIITYVHQQEALLSISCVALYFSYLQQVIFGLFIHDLRRGCWAWFHISVTNSAIAPCKHSPLWAWNPPPTGSPWSLVLQSPSPIQAGPACVADWPNYIGSYS